VESSGFLIEATRSYYAHSFRFCFMERTESLLLSHGDIRVRRGERGDRPLVRERRVRTIGLF
ncbi:MAG: hypothetical protein KDA36_07475, partial [Planctomycetaceae bacterium]|nr:hypothetical protein [Planctomycetaceae bacterium]